MSGGSGAPPPPPPGAGPPGGWGGPPPGPSPFPTPPPPRPVGKHLVLGALLGVAVAVVLPLGFGWLDATIGGVGSLVLLGLALALVLAVVLTALPRTRMLGAGMFIGFGVVLVAGAGLCVAILASLGGEVLA